MMNDALAGMIPYDSIGMYEPPKPRFFFKMPRVVPEQKSKYDSDELFRKLGRDTDVRYTGYRDRPQEERRIRFQNDLRTQGRTEIAFVQTGTNLQLTFNVNMSPYGPQERELDFDKEPGKVHFKASMIMNGVCVRFRGSLNLDSLEGTGCLEYDERRAAQEDAILRDQIERYNQRMRDLEDTKRAYRGERQDDLDAVRRGGIGVGVGAGMWRR